MAKTLDEISQLHKDSKTEAQAHTRTIRLTDGRWRIWVNQVQVTAHSTESLEYFEDFDSAEEASAYARGIAKAGNPYKHEG